MSELAEARAIAYAATPGPWELRKTSTVYMDGTGVYHIRTDGVPGVRGTLTVTRPDAEHIAWYDPPTVLAMLDAIEAAGKWHEVSMIPGNFTVKDTFASERDFIDKLARFYDLIGDDDD